MYNLNDEKKIEELLESALDLGYRYFDTAVGYQNE